MAVALVHAWLTLCVTSVMDYGGLEQMSHDCNMSKGHFNALFVSAGKDTRLLHMVPYAFLFIFITAQT